VGFEVITSVPLKFQAFWEVIPCCLVNSPLGILNPEDKGTTILRNVGNHLPTNTMLHPRSLEPSKINLLLLWMRTNNITNFMQ
jgi:hypothetical protein